MRTPPNAVLLRFWENGWLLRCLRRNDKSSSLILERTRLFLWKMVIADEILTLKIRAVTFESSESRMRVGFLGLSVEKSLWVSRCCRWWFGKAENVFRSEVRSAVNVVVFWYREMHLEGESLELNLKLNTFSAECCRLWIKNAAFLR